MTEDQVLAALQLIFTARFPESSHLDEHFVNLPETAQLLRMRREEFSGQSLENYYQELASDILTEVIVQMANGMQHQKAWAFHI